MTGRTQIFEAVFDALRKDIHDEKVRAEPSLGRLRYFICVSHLPPDSYITVRCTTTAG